MSTKELRRGEVLSRVKRGELTLVEAMQLLEVTLPGFDVHQIADNFLMNGGQNGQERFGSESTVHG